jgi:uncharacterized repeat protein (TIGR03943 family)
VQALPFLVLGVLLSGALAALIRRGWLAGALPANDLLAVPAACLAGAALPGCECASVPIAARLRAGGVRSAAASLQTLVPRGVLDAVAGNHLLAMVGVTALWLGLTDAALAYVRGTLRPPLVASGIALLGLAAVTAARRPGGQGHGHGHGAPRSGWLLALPVLMLLLAAPPALGSFAASRQAASATQASGDPGGAFPPLPAPVGGAVPLPVSEFVTRALYDKDRSLRGARVRLVGFAAPRQGGGYYLTRFNLFCCAADGQAYQLEVRGDRVPRQADQWLVVEGRWLPQKVYGEIAPSGVRPVLVANSVTTVGPPADRYEHNLYGI